MNTHYLFRANCRRTDKTDWAALFLLAIALLGNNGPSALAQPVPGPATSSSYDQITPVLLGKETFGDRMATDKAAKAAVTARQKGLLETRYDLTPRPDAQAKMSRGKPIQVGPTARLPQGTTWERLFFGKAQCATCHPAPYYTDNLMHDLAVERFYKTQTINGLVATSQGPIKTFPLRGIKDSPPYFHDGRLLTLEDTVEFFNLILELKLTSQEKSDIVAFMRLL